MSYNSFEVLFTIVSLKTYEENIFVVCIIMWCIKSSSLVLFKMPNRA